MANRHQAPGNNAGDVLESDDALAYKGEPEQTDQVIGATLVQKSEDGFTQLMQRLMAEYQITDRDGTAMSLDVVFKRRRAHYTLQQYMTQCNLKYQEAGHNSTSMILRQHISC